MKQQRWCGTLQHRANGLCEHKAISMVLVLGVKKKKKGAGNDSEMMKLNSPKLMLSVMLVAAVATIQVMGVGL